jgi:hypothetical protein
MAKVVAKATTMEARDAEHLNALIMRGFSKSGVRDQEGTAHATA